METDMRSSSVDKLGDPKFDAHTLHQLRETASLAHDTVRAARMYLLTSFDVGDSLAWELMSDRLGQLMAVMTYTVELREVSLGR